MYKFDYPETIQNIHGYEATILKNEKKTDFSVKMYIESTHNGSHDWIVEVSKASKSLKQYKNNVGNVEERGGVEFLLEDGDRVISTNVENSDNWHLVYGIVIEDNLLKIDLYNDLTKETERIGEFDLEQSPK